MAGNVNHQYHILEPDIWPFVASVSALTFTSGMVLYMHEMASAHLVLGLKRQSSRSARPPLATKKETPPRYPRYSLRGK